MKSFKTLIVAITLVIGSGYSSITRADSETFLTLADANNFCSQNSCTSIIEKYETENEGSLVYIAFYDPTAINSGSNDRDGDVDENDDDGDGGPTRPTCPTESSCLPD